MTRYGDRTAVRRAVLLRKPGEEFQSYQIAEETGIAISAVSNMIMWGCEDIVETARRIPGSREHVWRRIR